MEVEKQIIREQILKQNLKRFLILPLVSIPINIGHILFFNFSMPDSGSPEYDWYQGIIASHSVLVIAALLMLAVVFSRKKLSLPGDSFTWFLFHTVILLIILTGVAITITDQIVTPSITPLLITYVAVSVIFLIHPRNSIILFLIAFGLFFFLMPYTQANSEILLSNRLNGLTAMGLAYVISVILWKNNWSGIEQTIIIEKQQKVLERNNQELRAQTESLNETNATKDKLFLIIAHDLKNPFSGIIGLSEVLKDEARTLDVDEMENYASIIYDAADQAHELLENLLDWAKMQQGNIVFSPTTIKLKDLASNVLLLVNNNAIQKNINLENEIEEDIVIEADENMLNTILRNLLTNAVKFSNSGGTVTIYTTKTENGLQVHVKDNGIGISAVNISKLFKIGSDFNIRGTANEKGSGLGLVLCKEFIERHNGKLWVESEEGKGSAFNFLIPCEMG